MFPSNITIKEGAFFITDAHYSHLRPQFLEFIKAIELKQLQPPQIILMGDIFDSLIGEVSYTHRQNRTLIDLLNRLSQNIEIIYLEGNHDFNLHNIFPKIQIFSISQQPILVQYKKKKIYLSHGDFNADIGYKIYTSIIRNSVILSLLSFIDKIGNFFIMKKLDRYLSKKDDCKKLKNFPFFTEKRLNIKYSCDYFIDGHFHQNRRFQIADFIYINLGAFACNQRYFSVKLDNDKELLEEHIFLKE